MMTVEQARELLLKVVNKYIAENEAAWIKKAFGLSRARNIKSELEAMQAKQPKLNSINAMLAMLGDYVSGRELLEKLIGAVFAIRGIKEQQVKAEKDKYVRTLTERQSFSSLRHGFSGDVLLPAPEELEFEAKKTLFILCVNDAKRILNSASNQPLYSSL